MKDLEVLREFYKSLEFKDGIKHTIVEKPNGFDVEYSIEGNDTVKRVDHITILTGTTTDGEEAKCIQFQDEITTTFVHDGEEIKTRQLGLIESFQEINPDYLDADHFIYLVENVLNSQMDTLRVSVDGTLTHSKLDLVNKIKTHMTGALIVFFKAYENPFKHFVVVVGEKDVSIYRLNGRKINAKIEVTDFVEIKNNFLRYFNKWFSKGKDNNLREKTVIEGVIRDGRKFYNWIFFDKNNKIVAREEYDEFGKRCDLKNKS